MATYRYQNGDRPLDGFTIEQALGRGGFGEVYYAVSDSGRQVALKAVQNYEDIELRGISHCMNLKSPHLVSIFDVRYSDRGDPFVIMEYVAGPSLRDLLDESPDGLGPDKAAWFIREIAKGLALLHDNGIVHRDLKPHNVFFEDGYVKVGDYSLSKVITASHRSGHTLTVGTVHYMAPEIGVGRYDRTVDIYALGVLLYEMLTGQPPFVGETMGEVLMKHMTGDVDVSTLDEPYASVVCKALAKDPTERYQSVDELVADLFGNAAVVDGVSTFSPNSLTMVARRAAATAGRKQAAATAQRASGAQNVLESNGAQHWTPRRPVTSSSHSESTPYHLGRLWSRIGAAFCLAPARYADRVRRSEDAISLGRRVFFALTVLTMMAFISNGILLNRRPGFHMLDDAELWGQFFILGSIVLTVKLATAWIPGGQSGIPSIFSRLAMMIVAGLAGMFFEEAFHPFNVHNGIILGTGTGDGTIMATMLPLLVMDWQWLAARSRAGRIRLTPCLGAALIALIASELTNGEPLAAAAIAGAAALAVQAISEFDSASSRRLPDSVRWLTSAREAFGAWYGFRFPDIAAELRSLDRPQSGKAGWDSGAPLAAASRAANDFGAAETLARDSDLRAADGNATASSFTDGSATSIRHEVSRGDELPDAAPSRFAALVLCLLPFVTFGFVPICGLHRFVSGRIGSGLLWLFTFGLVGVGQLVDLILIALGEFRDAAGRPLRSRGTSEPVNGLSSVPAASLVSNGLAVLGGLALTATVMVGFLLAIDLPEMIAADVFRGFDLTGSDLEAVFGTKNWPELQRELLQLLSGILATIAAGLLMASRRSSGLSHLLKVPLAAIPFGMTYCLLLEAFSRIQWSRVAEGLGQAKIGLVLEVFLRSNDLVPSCVGAAAAFTVALLILALPSRQMAKLTTAQQVPTKQEA
ncbi:protein kinase [bacterium]|nr:protein kinase [bacterium]